MALRRDPDSYREWQERSRRKARESMKRRQGVKKVPGPKRGKRMRAVNHARLAKRREREFGPHAAWIRTLRCVIAGHDSGDCGPSVAAHVKSRGAGGTAKDLVPLCDRHHQEQHCLGITTFQERYDVDLRAIADDLWQNREASWAAQRGSDTRSLEGE